jgi:hypothetical protein
MPSAAVDAFSRRRADPRHNGSSLSEYTRVLNADLDDLKRAGGNATFGGYDSLDQEPSPVSSLRRTGTASPGGAPAGGGGAGYDPVTAYQAQRAEYEQSQSDRQDANIARARANDPGIQLYEDQRRRQRAAGDVEAADTIATDSFARQEPVRRMQNYEAEQQAKRMLPYNPAVIQSDYKREGVLDTNDARRDAATSAAGARTGAAAINSLARVAGTQTLGDPAAETRVGGAIEAIRPNVPGQANDAGLKPLPPEWDFNRVLEKFGGDEKKATEWLRANGYRRGT